MYVRMDRQADGDWILITPDTRQSMSAPAVPLLLLPELHAQCSASVRASTCLVVN